MQNILKVFKDLGQQVDQAWRRKNYNKNFFPQIAYDALSLSKLNTKITFSEIIELGLHSDPAINQWQENSPFGDLQLIPYRDNNFYIEILVWKNGSTSIHDHGFSGAFMVLDGKSINARYTFDVQQEINTNFKIGELQGQSFEFLQPGDLREIHAGRALIHAVYHLQEPTVSIVIRTYQDDWVMPQLEYRGNRIAVNQKLNNEFLNKIRTLKVLQSVDHNLFLSMAKTHIVDANIDEKYWLWRSFFASLDTPDFISATLADAEMFIIDVLRKEERIQNLLNLKATIADIHFKYFIDLIINIPDWKNINTLLRTHDEGYLDQFFAAILNMLKHRFNFSFKLSNAELVNSLRDASVKDIFMQYSNILDIKNPFKQILLDLG